MDVPLPRLTPLVATALTMLAPGLASQKPQDQLKASFAAMQTHDWYTGGGWTTDFATAKAAAAKTGRPILAYFTRTYAP